jgi:hypothetical protein
LPDLSVTVFENPGKVVGDWGVNYIGFKYYLIHIILLFISLCFFLSLSVSLSLSLSLLNNKEKDNNFFIFQFFFLRTLPDFSVTVFENPSKVVGDS